MIEGGNFIDRTGNAATRHRRHERTHGRAICAKISQRHDLQTQNPALCIERQRRRCQIVPPVRISKKHLRTITRPLHRSLEFSGREKAQAGFRMHFTANAESTTRITGDDSDCFGWHLENRLGQHALLCIGSLAWIVERELAVIVAANTGPGFERAGDDPVVHQVDYDDMRSLCQSLLERALISVLVMDGQIGTMRLVQHLRVRAAGLPQIDYRRQICNRQLDKLRGIPRLLSRLGDNRDHRLADEADPVLCQDWSMRNETGFVVAVLEHCPAR